MGHQNAKKLIYAETLHKTESPKKNSKAQHLRRKFEGLGGGGGGVCVTYPPTTTPPLTLKLKCHNIIDIT